MVVVRMRCAQWLAIASWIGIKFAQLCSYDKLGLADKGSYENNRPHRYGPALFVGFLASFSVRIRPARMGSLSWRGECSAQCWNDHKGGANAAFEGQDAVDE